MRIGFDSRHRTSVDKQVTFTNNPTNNPTQQLACLHACIMGGDIIRSKADPLGSLGAFVLEGGVKPFFWFQNYFFIIIFSKPVF